MADVTPIDHQCDDVSPRLPTRADAQRRRQPLDELLLDAGCSVAIIFDPASGEELERIDNRWEPPPPRR